MVCSTFFQEELYNVKTLLRCRVRNTILLDGFLHLHHLESEVCLFEFVLQYNANSYWVILVPTSNFCTSRKHSDFSVLFLGILKLSVFTQHEVLRLDNIKFFAKYILMYRRLTYQFETIARFLLLRMLPSVLEYSQKAEAKICFCYWK